MPLVPLKSHTSATQSLYAPYYAVGNMNASTISTGTITASEAYISSISTSAIILDGEILTAAPGEILLNGIPLATQSSLSTISDWSIFPAVSTVQMVGNDLNAAGTVSSANIRAGNGFFQNLIAYNAMFVSTQTSTISSLVISADAANFSSISTGYAIAGLGEFSTINSGNISTAQIQVPEISSLSTINGIPVGAFENISTFSTLNVSSLGASFADISGLIVSSINGLPASAYENVSTFSTLNVSTLVADFISTPSLYVSSINGAEFTSTTIVVEAGSFSSLTANSISSLGAEIRQALVSTIQFKPDFNLDLNFDTASLVGGLKAGLTNIGIGVGAGTAIVGSGLIASAVSRSGANSIYNTEYEQYATTTQFQFSTLGAATSTFFRTVSSSGQANTVPGTEIILSTIIPAGTLAVRSVSDPINLPDQSTVYSSIQAFGNWVVVPPELTTSTFSTLAVADLTANRIQTSSITGGEASLLTIGAPLIYLSTGGPAPLVYTDGEMDAFRFESAEVYTSSILTSSIVASTLYAQGSLFTPQIYAPTLNVSANTTLDLVGGTRIGMIAPAVYLNFAGVNNSIAYGSTISTTQVVADTLSAQGATVSSLTIAKAGATYGLSSLFGISSAIVASGTSSVVVLNTDFSVGNNILWGKQARLGFGNADDNISEVLMYGSGGDFRVIKSGNTDKTLRFGTNVSGNNTGYALDTLLNPPFFSTINQSTAQMCYFPSTLVSTIGYSTLSFVPPKVVAANFTSLSTQNLVANTPLALWLDSTDFARGGIATSTNTIVMPSAGIYEIIPSIQFEHPAGAAVADFWLRVNGTDIPNTASEVYLPVGGSGQTLGVTSFIVPCSTGDKIQIMVATPDTGVTAAFHQSTIAPYAKPANPSVVVAVKCLNY